MVCKVFCSVLVIECFAPNCHDSPLLLLDTLIFYILRVLHSNGVKISVIYAAKYGFQRHENCRHAYQLPARILQKMNTMKSFVIQELGNPMIYVRKGHFHRSQQINMD